MAVSSFVAIPRQVITAVDDSRLDRASSAWGSRRREARLSRRQIHTDGLSSCPNRSLHLAAAPGPPVQKRVEPFVQVFWTPLTSLVAVSQVAPAAGEASARHGQLPHGHPRLQDGLLVPPQRRILVRRVAEQLALFAVAERVQVLRPLQRHRLRAGILVRVL